MLTHGSLRRPQQTRCYLLAAAMLGYGLPALLQAQVSCIDSGSVPPTIRSSGNAEYIADLVLNCAGGGSPGFVDFQIFLNTPFTSSVVNAATGETEALLLLNEPMPAPAVNSANGVTYVGQVKGEPGVPAGAPGSGNAYQGTVSGASAVVFSGVPIVPGANFILRFTNIRISASGLPDCSPLPCVVLAAISATGSPNISIFPGQATLAFVESPLILASRIVGDTAVVRFTEGYPSAFRKRIENTTAGPLSPARQNVPGGIFCTESGFTPDYSSLNPGDIGSASTGTRLAEVLTNIPAGVTSLEVPNSVPGTDGQTVLRRLNPPYGAHLAGGTFAPASGIGNVPVNPAARTAVLLYEVMAMAPFAGVNGCLSLHSYTVAARAVPSTPLTGTSLQGLMAPVDNTVTPSGPSPEPRFQH